MTKLVSPVVTIQLEQESSEDLLEYEVQTDNRDAVQWDLLRGRKGWPAAQDAPVLWLTVLAWHALTRSKETKLSVDEFLKVCVAVHTKKDHAPVDPTPPAVAPGS